MLKLKSLILFALLALTPLHLTANTSTSNPVMAPIISYLLSDSSFSFSDLAGKTKYFVNENGSIGYRDYIDSDTYDGVVNGIAVSGTYTYDENSMTLTRDDGTILVFTNPRPTVFGDGITFDLSVNGSPTFETHNYDTEEERDAYIQTLSYSYVELASNTYYGVTEDGSGIFVVTYDELGTYDRNLTVGSFDQLNLRLQTYAIADNVIIVDTNATITRIGIYTDYDRILFDPDGAGAREAVYKRIYSDRAKAEAFHEEAYIEAMSYSYEELASNTYFGVNEDRSAKFVVTYAELGTNERNLTVGSFDQTNQRQQTYTIADNVITVDENATITRVAIYADYNQILFDLDGNGTGHEPVSKRIYSDRAKAEAFDMAYSYDELDSNTYYGVNEDSSGIFVVTYAELGTNERNLTVGSFDQTNDIQQTFTIVDNVITLDENATIMRIDMNLDYSRVLYDHDGAGPGEAVYKRLYSARDDAQAFYDSITVSFASDVMPIFEVNCKSCHTSNNRTFKVGDAAYTHDNIITNNLIDTTFPDSSSILIKGNGGDSHSGGDQLSDDNSTIVKDWIVEGGMNN